MAVYDLHIIDTSVAFLYSVKILEIVEYWGMPDV